MDSHVILSGEDSPDPLTKVFLVDVAGPFEDVVRDFRRALRDVRGKVPHRDVDPRILEAVRFKRHTGVPYTEVSRKFFGTRNRADAIRYWDNSATHQQLPIFQKILEVSK